jgi:hypothetical protein
VRKSEREEQPVSATETRQITIETEAGDGCSPLTIDDELVEKKRVSARCKNGRGR